MHYSLFLLCVHWPFDVGDYYRFRRVISVTRGKRTLYPSVKHVMYIFMYAYITQRYHGCRRYLLYIRRVIPLVFQYTLFYMRTFKNNNDNRFFCPFSTKPFDAIVHRVGTVHRCLQNHVVLPVARRQNELIVCEFDGRRLHL